MGTKGPLTGVEGSVAAAEGSADAPRATRSGTVAGSPGSGPGGAAGSRSAWTREGWTAWWDGGRLRLDGDGDPIDGLRVACAAAWRHAGNGRADADAVQEVLDMLVARLKDSGDAA
ncbi:hypothetical protein [Sphaerisporangium aureirubrum]|uniref:GCN5-related N-acetyltransferase-like domain-containing protein n=1 Tax=Sphaerisporangium aureirubrum TaxID=1544736 RepID=A0ABW1NKI2_9ACTN